jgi:hypothetical protein
MRFREAAILFCAVVSLAISHPRSRSSKRPVGGRRVVNFFKNLSVPTKRTTPRRPLQPPAAVGAPAGGAPNADSQQELRSRQADADRASAPTSLHGLVAKGDFDGARKAIEQGADLEAKDPGTGASVLHYAVMRGNPEILQLLLSKGVDVNSRTRTARPAAHRGLYNRYEVAEMLLNKGADVDAKSSSGATPLAIATTAAIATSRRCSARAARSKSSARLLARVFEDVLAVGGHEEHLP